MGPHCDDCISTILGTWHTSIAGPPGDQWAITNEWGTTITANGTGLLWGDNLETDFHLATHWLLVCDEDSGGAYMIQDATLALLHYVSVNMTTSTGTVVAGMQCWLLHAYPRC